MTNNVLRLRLERGVFLQHDSFGRSENAVKSAQDREWQDDLAVLVALVWTTEQVADAPDEVGDLGMGLGGHVLCSRTIRSSAFFGNSYQTRSLLSFVLRI